MPRLSCRILGFLAIVAFPASVGTAQDKEKPKLQPVVTKGVAAQAPVRKVGIAGPVGGNWDFETGDLRDWQCEGTASGSCAGTAFANQPTYGNNVAARYPGLEININGNYWIGTYENHHAADAPLGGVQGDGPTGTLVSKRFVINTPFIRFRVGGGSTARGVRVQLVTTGDVEQGGLLLEAAGQDDEVMRPVTWDVRRFAGSECFIRIVDRGTGGWGHINVDDFEFGSGAPGPEAFRGWDFENLEDVRRTWTMEGAAFDRQPTYGDNVTSSRLGLTSTQLAQRSIGGNYWDVPFPNGAQGHYWIGTYENRATPADPWGTTRGDGPVGTMTSVEFTLNHPYVSFLIGGGGDINSERVELVINAADFDRIPRLPGRTLPFVRRDGDQVVVLQATGRNSELMRRQLWDVSPYRSTTAQIRVVDSGSGGWGHINVDDFQFTDAPVRAAAEPVWGFADTHTHPMANLGFGGQLYWGSPEGPYETALPACEPAHGIYGTGLRDVGAGLNIIGAVLPELAALGFEAASHEASNQMSQLTTGRSIPDATPEQRERRLLQALVNIVSAVNRDALLQLGVLAVERRIGHRTHGWPEMDGWPRFDSPMHEHMHELWIKRAYEGGLRLMVAHVVNTEIIGHLRPKPGHPIDDRAVTELELDEMEHLAARNPWMGIAHTSAEARQIISQNRLAVVLGVEVDSLNNWRTDADCTDAQVDEYLRHLYDRGVRHIFPIHLATSPFGAPSLYDDIFNFNSWSLTNHLQPVRSGADSRGVGYEVQFRLLEDAPSADDAIWTELLQLLHEKHLESLTLPSGHVVNLIDAVTAAQQAKRDYDAVPGGHLNQNGLTARGRHAIEQMMSLGMIIDIDHMSDLSTGETLQMAGQREENGVRGYPIASGHSTFREIKWRRGETGSSHKYPHESDKTPDSVERVRQLGGMIAPITLGVDVRQWGRHVANDAPGTSKSWAQAYLYAIDKMHGKSVALGTDMAILGGLGPRFGSWAAIGTQGDEIKARQWLDRVGRNSPLAEGETASRRVRRFEADAQTRGVRYSTPIRNVLSYRFEGPEDLYSGQERDVWAAVIEGRSDTDIDAANFGGEIAGYRTPGLVAWMKDVAKGVRAAVHGQPISALPEVTALTNNVAGLYNYAVVQRAAWYAYNGTNLDAIADQGIRGETAKIINIADIIKRMDGPNPPLTRLVVGNHDFDFNLDGLANYGLLPDMLQDVRNVGAGAEDMAPLFRSAEDYIQMWEKCERMQTVH